MTLSTSLTRGCLLLSLFAAACSSNSKGGLGGGPLGGVDAGSGGSSSASGGATSGSGGGIDTASGGGTAAAGGATASDAGNAGGSEDGGNLSPDGGGGSTSTPSGACRTNADCANVAGKLLCEAATHKCIACHTNAQCSDTEECVNAVCTKLPECQNSLDCASAAGGKSICDKPNGVCVQCTQDADCGANKVCTDRVCRASCSSDNDCAAQHLLCNQNLGFNAQCTQCVVDSDCKSGNYCESGTCVPQTCKPAQQSCDGNLLVECNESGSGVTPLTQCTLVLLSSCAVRGDNAKCVGPCENGRQDGLETDVDCGGPTCPRCAAKQSCLLPTDCSSGNCKSSTCQ